MPSKEQLRRKDSVLHILDEYLSLEKNFVSPPKIQLELLSRVPPGYDDVGVRDIVTTTAVQCYAPGVAKLRLRQDEKSISIAESTLKAGHHTTRMHTSYTWKLEGLSRSVVHDIFHAYPFYNSEQQSQRYVEAKPGSYIVPNNMTEEQKKIYIESAEFTNHAYGVLLEKLEEVVKTRVVRMYPIDGWKVEKTKNRLEGKIKKISQEVARYVLPIGQKTTMDHTLTELQLLRLFRASQLPHVSKEGKFVVAKMIQEVSLVDQSILDELDIPVQMDESYVFDEHYIQKHKQEFDQMLGDNQSVLLVNPEISRDTLARALRNVLGVPSTQLSDSEALSLLLDPAKNQLLTDVYDAGMMDSVTAALRQVSLT